MDFNTVHGKYTSHANDQLDKEAGRATDGIAQIYDGSLPTSVKLDVMTQIADITEKAAVTGSVDGAALTRQPVLALAAGSNAPSTNGDQDLIDKVKSLAQQATNTPEKLLEQIEQILAWISSATTTEAKKSRALALSRMCSGEFDVVGNQGALQLEADKQQLTNELSSLHRETDQFLTPLRTLSDSDKRTRMKGMQLVADGTTPVKPDGSVDIPDNAALQQERDNAVQAQQDAEQQRDANQHVIDDVKAHIRGSRRPNSPNRVFDVTKLTDESRAALDITL